MYRLLAAAALLGCLLAAVFGGRPAAAGKLPQATPAKILGVKRIVHDVSYAGTAKPFSQYRVTLYNPGSYGYVSLPLYGYTVWGGLSPAINVLSSTSMGGYAQRHPQTIWIMPLAPHHRQVVDFDVRYNPIRENFCAGSFYVASEVKCVPA